MLSLLRWGLGSGHEHLSDKERLAAVEKHHARSTAPGMESPRPHKRKRADTAVTPSKLAKRRPSSHIRPVLAPPGDSRPADTLRVVNSPGAALLAQQVERDATAAPVTLVTAPHALAPASLLDRADLGVIDLPPPVAAPAAAPPRVAPPPVVPTSALRQTIVTEFGLEILLKHKELRLIDQEIAKCQVALEQLRRCQVVPFPSQSARPSARLDVSGGVGRPVRSAHTRQAAHPPPWGVTDGPYSRHYAQWLLPDHRFDGGVADDYALPRTGKLLPDRHTRGSKGEAFLLASKRLRGAPPSRLQALPAGYPEPKEHKGPMILKRAADDKMVKLVCLDCQREDFNSAQGFINHCRIAHSRGFASHEAAAQACGHEVEPHDIAPAPIHTPAEPGTGVHTPAGALVHPLVKSYPTVPTLSIPVPRAHRPTATPLAPIAVPPVAAAPAAPFTPSADTPHLSKLFVTHNHGGDLSLLVADAKIRTDLEAVMSSDADSDSDAGEASDASSAPPMTRMPSRGALRAGPIKSTAAAEAHKGVARVARRAAGPTASGSTSLDLPAPPHDLSPHAVESNVAPSLVSDNDDDDYEDGQSSASPSTHSSDGEDEVPMDVDVDVALEDVPRLRGGAGGVHHLDPETHVTMAASSKSADPELRASGAAAAAATRRGRSSAKADSKKRGRPRKVQA